MMMLLIHSFRNCLGSLQPSHPKINIFQLCKNNPHNVRKASFYKASIQIKHRIYTLRDSMICKPSLFWVKASLLRRHLAIELTRSITHKKCGSNGFHKSSVSINQSTQYLASGEVKSERRQKRNERKEDNDSGGHGHRLGMGRWGNHESSTFPPSWILMI